MTLDPELPQFTVADVLAAIPGLPALTLRNWCVRDMVPIAQPSRQRGGSHKFCMLDIAAIAVAWRIVSATNMPISLLRGVLFKAIDRAAAVWRDASRREEGEFIIDADHPDKWRRWAVFLDGDGTVMAAEADDLPAIRFLFLPQAYLMVEVDVVVVNIFNHFIRRLP